MSDTNPPQDGNNPYGRDPYGQNPYGQPGSDPDQQPAQGQYGPPGAQPPYAPQGGHPYPVARPNHGLAVPALVLGIVSVVVCGIGILAGIPALVMGRKAVREIDASNGQLEGRSLATAGWITGLVGTILSVLVILLYAALFGFVFWVEGQGY